MVSNFLTRSNMPIAFAEFLHYIKKFDQYYIDKIPRNLLDYFEKKRDKNYICDFDYNKPLKDIQLKPETRLLINVICYQYWCENDEQKKMLSQKWIANEKILQEKEAQERIIKEKEATKKIVQESAIQEKIVQEKIVQEKIAQEREEQIKALVIYNSYKWYQKIIFNLNNVIKKIFKRPK